jgi:hypothetical protein
MHSKSSLLIFAFIFLPFLLNADNTISVIPEKLDFGTFQAKDKKEVSVKILNNGDSPVKIINIRNTCSCAEIKIDSKEIPSKGSTELKVMLQPEGIYGEFVKNIYIETDSKAERFLTITISGNALALVKVIPESVVNLGILKKNTKLKQELELQVTDNNIEFGIPVTKSEFPITATLTSQKSGSFTLGYEIDSGNQNRKLNSEITIPIIKPEGWKPVIINITGHVSATIQAIPSKITLPNDSAPITKKIRLRFQGIDNLDASKLSFTSIKGVEIESKKTTSSEIEALLKITPSLLPQGKPHIQFQYPDISSATVEFER